MLHVRMCKRDCERALRSRTRGTIVRSVLVHGKVSCGYLTVAHKLPSLLQGDHAFRSSLKYALTYSRSSMERAVRICL